VLSSRLAFGRGVRGQALIIAVLILFAVATLAALFAAIIGSQVAQVTRHGDVVALRNIAEAGLRFANEQLTYSAWGADWRPSDDPYRCGRGQVVLDVSYGPLPDDLQSRYVRIVATAIFPDNPFLRHTILGLKPLLLTDYARFISDRFQTDGAAVLGAPGVELGGSPRTDYFFTVEGPIRCNTDLVWYGFSQVNLHTMRDPVTSWQQLQVLRDDRIEVAGRLEPADVTTSSGEVLKLIIDGVSRAGNVFWPITTGEQQDYERGYPDWTGTSFDANSSRVLAQLPVRQLSPFQRLEPPYLAVPRVRPPAIDAPHPSTQISRYLVLTRDSGRWVQRADGTWYNPGAYGWGWTDFGGIYIDNTEDIQYNHDLERLRKNWLASVGRHTAYGGDRRVTLDVPPDGPADWWDETARHYEPPGVEIILHGESVCGYIEIIRHDWKETTDLVGNPVYYYWQAPDGTAIPASDPIGFQYAPALGANVCWPQGAWVAGVQGNTARLPFPPNGVIYVEGNVRVRGVVPPAHVVDNWVPRTYLELGRWQEGKGAPRRYDLQIVSGGTIYIEGDILAPRAAGLLPNQWDVDIYRGCRLALLARDHVCVNTTAFHPRPADLAPTPETAADEQYNDGQPVYPPGGHPRYWKFQGVAADPAEEDAPRETVPPGADLVYRNVRLQIPDLRAGVADLRLIIGHSGWYTVGGADQDPGAPPPPDTGTHEADVRAVLEINDELWYWEQADSEHYTFINEGARTSDQSGHWYTEEDHLEPLPDGYQMLQVAVAGNDRILFTSFVTPVAERDDDGNPIGWEVAPEELAYILGPVAVAPPNRVAVEGGYQTPDPLPVQIQALIYAQNGCWFIIPGPWFNEDPGDAAAAAGGFTTAGPGYHEPLNIQIRVYGAVSENMPASLGEVAEWTSKWCGPAGNSADFLAYEYDPLLAHERTDENGRGCPRFPNFPLTADLVIWGERVSAGAGT
jgi:hypothetical protein